MIDISGKPHRCHRFVRQFVWETLRNTPLDEVASKVNQGALSGHAVFEIRGYKAWLDKSTGGLWGILHDSPPSLRLQGGA